MERIDYVPLGSVVLLSGGTQKLLVVARALLVKSGDQTCFFDYGGVLYPEGLNSDRMAYFNHDGISRVIFRGFDDAENQNIVDSINKFLEENPNVPKGDPHTWGNNAP